MYKTEFLGYVDNCIQIVPLTLEKENFQFIEIGNDYKNTRLANN